MKFTCYTFLLLFSIAAFGQSPQAINYQSVLRNSTGNVMPNQPVGVKINIHQGSSTGTIVYSETHTDTTNQFGLFTLGIGLGNPVSGIFANINWSSGIYYNEVLIDASGGTNYTSMGSAELLSVPYAFYADKSGSSNSTTNNVNIPVFSQSQIDTLHASMGFTVYNSTTNCLNYYSGSTWFQLCGNCVLTPTATILQPSHNYSIYSYNYDTVICGTSLTLIAQAVTGGTSQWTVISGNGGVFSNPTSLTTTFTGSSNSCYTIQYKVTTQCGTATAQKNIRFAPNTPPNLQVQQLSNGIEISWDSTITHNPTCGDIDSIFVYSAPYCCSYLEYPLSANPIFVPYTSLDSGYAITVAYTTSPSYHVCISDSVSGGYAPVALHTFSYNSYTYDVVAPTYFGYGYGYGSPLNASWANSTNYLGATSLTNGLSNSTTIISNTTSSAALACENLSYGGYTDWYLPALDELNAVYQNNSTLHIQSSVYWSSTEISSTNAYVIDFSSGSQISNNKGNYYSYVCVRH